MSNIASKLNDLRDDLHYGREVIDSLGGSFSERAGFLELLEEAQTIHSAIGTVKNSDMTLVKPVPENSIMYCSVDSLGGMTYKCNNLITTYVVADVVETSGVTFTVNADKSITANGIPTGSFNYNFIKIPLSAGTYTYSANGISKLRSVVSLRSKANNTFLRNIGDVMASTPKKTFTLTDEEAANYNVCINLYNASGVLENETIYPMLNAGTTALPYEDYYEGLRDTKPTAIKVSGANLLDFEAALKYWKMPYTKEGNSFATTTVFDNGYSYPYKFTDKAGVCTISLTSISVIGLNGSRIDIGYMDENGSFTRKGTFYLSGDTTSYTTSSEVNAIRLNYSSVTGEAISVTFNELRINRGTTVAPYTDYHESITYPIPEAVQGTGKGVDGASDTMDFEDGKLIIKTKTIALGDAGGYQMIPLGGSENPYVSDDGLVSAFTYDLKDYLETLRTKALCNVLPFTSDWTGKTFGFVLPSGTTRYVKVSIKAADAGVSTSDEYRVIISKIVQWLKDNNATLTYAIEEPTEEPISTDFGVIPVEAGGSIEIVTDNGNVIPNTISFQTIL